MVALMSDGLGGYALLFDGTASRSDVLMICVCGLIVA
jgi:hypothetical protein